MKLLEVLVKSGCAATFLVALQVAGQAGPARGPIQSSFRVDKVVLVAGVESLEDAANVAIGDLVQYTATHRNVSKRRLLRVQFSIPVPPGTSYVEGSAQPAGGQLVQLANGRSAIQWQLERLEPGESVPLSLRVRIDPDPSLRPAPVGKPRPELRR